MKQIVILGLIGMLAGSAFAADPSSKEKVTNASKQLDGKKNYSWTTTRTEADGSPGQL